MVVAVLDKALRGCRFMLSGPHSTIPMRTVCLIVLIVAFYVAKRVLAGEVDFDICLAPSHVTGTITWTELAKR
jgi:hypothetical protein